MKDAHTAVQVGMKVRTVEGELVGRVVRTLEHSFVVESQQGWDNRAPSDYEVAYGAVIGARDGTVLLGIERASVAEAVRQAGSGALPFLAGQAPGEDANAEETNGRRPALG